jgi:hypothetical protein
MKIFSEFLNFFWGNGKISTQKFHLKNLTENFFLFKIEHLIHLTKKGKKHF